MQQHAQQHNQWDVSRPSKVVCCVLSSLHSDTVFRSSWRTARDRMAAPAAAH